MKYVYFDACAGVSGDMILGALLDLGIAPSAFLKKMAELKLPAEITIKEVKRASLRGLKVDVRVKSNKNITENGLTFKTFLRKALSQKPAKAGQAAFSKGCSKPKPMSTAGNSTKPISMKQEPMMRSST